MNTLTDTQAKELIFTTLGIEKAGAASWQDKPVSDILSSLRESAGYAQQDVGDRLHPPVTYARVQQMEHSLKPGHIVEFLKILKPRLHQLASEGWLNPENLTIRDERYDEIALASAYLRESGQARAIAQDITNIRAFEKNPHIVSFARLLEIAAELSDYCHATSLTDLLEKTNDTARTRHPEHYAPAQKRAIGRATEALLEFLGLGQKDLVEQGLFTQQSAVSLFMKGELAISMEKVSHVPAAIQNAWQAKHPGEALPEEAKCANVEELVEKGNRLADVHKDYLRAGITRLLQESGKSAASLARESGLSQVQLSGFLNSQGRYADLSTCHIAKTLKPLNIPDIFTLDAMGKAVYTQNNRYDAAGGFDDNGKPLPEVAGEPRAGSYMVREAMQRLVKARKFPERE